MYQPIIGMEVHVELNTNSKMFCSCKNSPDENEPNKHICPICVGHPGTLPVPNAEAIKKTVLIGKALGCQIAQVSKFDRKNYFYPDLPKGYQISQYDQPIAENGSMRLTLELEENHRDVATIGITRAHLEEDTAKLLHDTDGNTLVDFNRSGTPLVEIVTDPDFESGAEAKKYCQELRTLFRALGVSDADMEKGHMRCEANISVQAANSFDIVDGVVHPRDGVTLNSKVELKNLNSFKAVERGIAFEIDRQTKMIQAGESWPQQTRGWDEDKGETVMQRAKENAADYRYFPEPDIPPFHPIVIAGNVSVPELPSAKRARFRDEYGFSYADAQLLASDNAWATFAEQVMSELAEWLHSSLDVKGDSDDMLRGPLSKLAGGWITSKLMGQMNLAGKTIDQLALSPENFAELLTLIHTKKVNSTNAQKILTIMVASDKDQDPSHLMEEKGWGQVTDEGTLGKVVEDVIASYPDQVAQFKAGKDPVLKFLVGMAMKATEGSADPKVIEQLFKEQLQ